MNYCIKYTNKFRYFDNDNVEIEIMYTSTNKLLDFCKNVLKESQKLVVNIIDENDSYCIVQGGTNYGLSVYDHIVLNASTVSEDDLLY